MYEFHPYFTNDGSVGLYNSDFDDIYHSAAGALTEAYEKFIYPVDFAKLLSHKTIKILDICYGVGYNSKSFLNYLHENNFFEKFHKKNSSYKNNIVTIHTNNIFDKFSRILSKNKNVCKQYNATVHTYNISDNKTEKIIIKAVDNDKILTYLSPFIKTGVKNINNQHFNFNYDAINKFLDSKKKIEHKKIDKIINFLILENLIKSGPEIFENEEFLSIINSKEFSRYFDKNLIGVFKFYKNNIYKNTSIAPLLPFLHNI